MNILFITRKYPPAVGGMETFSASLARAFGSEMDVLALRHKRQYHLIWWMPLTLLRVLFRGRRYDVIHFGDGVLALIGVIARWWCCRPISITVHGLDVTYHRFFYQSLIWPALRTFDRIICVSNATAQIVKQHGIVPKRVVVIPNGIVTERWMLRQTATTTGKFLTVGRLVPRKGVLWFVSEVMPKLPSNVTYHIVGCGPEENHIRAAIEHNNLHDRVIIHGHVSDEKRNALYVKSGALLLPNIARRNDIEGFGIVALEAGACGLPTIAADIEGLRDAIIDGVTGFLVESCSVSAWIDRIERFLQEQPLSPEAIRRAVEERYSMGAIVEEYRKEFNTLRSTTNGKRSIV